MIGLQSTHISPIIVRCHPGRDNTSQTVLGIVTEDIVEIKA